MLTSRLVLLYNPAVVNGFNHNLTIEDVAIDDENGKLTFMEDIKPAVTKAERLTLVEYIADREKDEELPELPSNAEPDHMVYVIHFEVPMSEFEYSEDKFKCEKANYELIETRGRDHELIERKTGKVWAERNYNTYFTDNEPHVERSSYGDDVTLRNIDDLLGITPAEFDELTSTLPINYMLKNPFYGCNFDLTVKEIGRVKELTLVRGGSLAIELINKSEEVGRDAFKSLEYLNVEDPAHYKVFREYFDVTHLKQLSVICAEDLYASQLSVEELFTTSCNSKCMVKSLERTTTMIGPKERITEYSQHDTIISDGAYIVNNVLLYPVIDLTGIVSRPLTTIKQEASVGESTQVVFIVNLETVFATGVKGPTKA